MQSILRIIKIYWVIARFRLDTFINTTRLPWYLRILVTLLPWRLFFRAKGSSEARLRGALIALGPVFIKFGQTLSTRRDLLPPDLANELALLQDRVPPFEGAHARQLIEKQLGANVDELFAEFDAEPLASASVAQVHPARLKDGRAVVVKVIRPGIERVIRQDVALLYVMARMVQNLWSEGKRLRPVEVVEEYEQTIFDELDLRKEAANATQLRRNFADSDILYVPEVYWDFTRQSVMVMERISGIPVADVDALEGQGTNMEKLAERGVEIFFTQVFRDSFFHADMHPGNIFVSRENPEDPQYIAVDFGIVGSLSPEDQSYLARNILAFFQRDYRLVAQLHIDSGWVPADTNVHAFETAIRSVCEPIFEKPLKDISFGMVLLGLFQTARRFNMVVQPQLILLQKTLLNIEGLGRQLYPELDLWKTGKPFLENWMKERMGVKAMIKNIKQQAPDWIEKLPQIPQLVFDNLQQNRQAGELEYQRMIALQHAQEQRSRNTRRTLLLAATLAAATALAEPSVLAWVESLPGYAWLPAGLAWLLVWRA